MSARQTRSFDELSIDNEWPLSRLYHENSKLGEYSSHGFQATIAEYSGDIDALRRSARPWKNYAARPPVTLPRSSWWHGRGRLARLLRSRRTRRAQFRGRPLSLGFCGALLDLACGVTGKVVHPEHTEIAVPLRAWPSGGGMYPIEVYPLILIEGDLQRGVYHYQPQTHGLAQLGPLPADDDLQRIVFAEGLWTGAAALVMLTAVMARTQIKYGERGYRIALIDAGHVAQNLLLAAEDLRLAAVPLAGFLDDDVARVLGVDPARELAVHAILFGYR